MSLDFSSKNFQNSFLGLNYSLQKSCGNVLFKLEGGPNPKRVGRALESAALSGVTIENSKEKPGRREKKGANKENREKRLEKPAESGVPSPEAQKKIEQAALDARLSIAVDHVFEQSDNASALEKAQAVLNSVPDNEDVAGLIERSKARVAKRVAAAEASEKFSLEGVDTSAPFSSSSLETGSLVSFGNESGGKVEMPFISFKESKPLSLSTDHSSAVEEESQKISQDFDVKSWGKNKDFVPTLETGSLISFPKDSASKKEPKPVESPRPVKNFDLGLSVEGNVTPSLETASLLSFEDAPSHKIEKPLVTLGQEQKEQSAPRKALEAMFEKFVDVRDPATRKSVEKLLLALPEDERAEAKQRLKEHTASRTIRAEFERQLETPNENPELQAELVERLISQLPESEQVIARRKLGGSVSEGVSAVEKPKESVVVAKSVEKKVSPEVERSGPREALEAMFEKFVDVRDPRQYELLKQAILQLPQDERADAIERVREHTASRALREELDSQLENPNENPELQAELVERLISQLPENEQIIARKKAEKFSRVEKDLKSEPTSAQDQIAEALQMRNDLIAQGASETDGNIRLIDEFIRDKESEVLVAETDPDYQLVNDFFEGRPSWSGPEAEVSETVEDTEEEPEKVSKAKEGVFSKIRKSKFGKLLFGAAAAGAISAAVTQDSSQRDLSRAQESIAATASVDNSSSTTNTFVAPASEGKQAAAPLQEAPVVVKSVQRAESPVLTKRLETKAPQVVETARSVSKEEAPRSKVRVFTAKSEKPAEAPAEVQHFIKTETQSSVRNIEFNPSENPLFEKVGKYSKTYFNIADNAIYKELGDKVMQVKFDKDGKLLEGCIASKRSGTSGEYAVKQNMRFNSQGIMYFGNQMAPDVLQEWAQKMQEEYPKF